MTDFFNKLQTGARVGLAAGLLFIVLATAVLAWWMLRSENQVLFADLKPQDAAVMTGELERLKIPYQLGDNGTAVLVEKSIVLPTRIKLMGRDLPLQGVVGLELFNNTDFGMTEFAQKINYQRALQGELTRTISALSEIRDVRVHLAFTEQGLFKQGAARPKAAITLTMKHGQVLNGEQVSGIQRLVAAAVAGMTMQDVTLVDHRGVALSKTQADSDPAPGSARLDLKRETEDYLSRKAGAVLERALGPGQALASVDVSLNMDQSRVTTEDVLPAPPGAQRTQRATGVVVHERETVRDGSAPLEIRSADAARPAGANHRETDYQTGKRVEQVVSQPGSIRRIQVVTVVRQSLSAARRDQIKALVSGAVGASAERGDIVVVEAFEAATPFQDDRQAAAQAAGKAPPSASAQDALQGVSSRAQAAPASGLLIWLGAALLLLCATLPAAYLILRLRRKTPGKTAAGTSTARLSEAQRQAALQQVMAWMGGQGV